MAQVHKKFSTDQVKVSLSSYERGRVRCSEAEDALGIGKARFLSLLKR